MRVRILAALVAIPIVAQGIGPASAHRDDSQFTVAVSLMQARGGAITIQAHTRIGSTCMATALYDNGAAAASIGAAQHVGNTGIVRWQWHPNSQAATVAVACSFKGQMVLNQARLQVKRSVNPANGAATDQGTSPDAPGIKVTAISLSDDDNYGKYYDSNGGYYAHWSVTIENDSNKPFAFSKNMFILIGDKEHDQYHVNYGDHTGLLDRTLPPTQSITDDIWFFLHPGNVQEYLNLYWQPKPTSKPAEVFQ